MPTEITDLNFLNQLVQSLADLERKLEESYLAKNSEEFNDTKKMIMKIYNQIKEDLK